MGNLYSCWWKGDDDACDELPAFLRRHPKPAPLTSRTPPPEPIASADPVHQSASLSPLPAEPDQQVGFANRRREQQPVSVHQPPIMFQAANRYRMPRTETNGSPKKHGRKYMYTPLFSLDQIGTMKADVASGKPHPSLAQVRATKHWGGQVRRRQVKRRKHSRLSRRRR